MDKIKCYFTSNFTNDKSYYLKEIIKKLKKQEDIEVIRPIRRKNDIIESYNIDKEKLLECNILIACLDDVDNNNTSCEIGIFSGALETMKYFNIPHEPTIIIGIRLYKDADCGSFVEGACQRWGAIANDFDDLFQIIKEFKEDYYN